MGSASASHEPASSLGLQRDGYVILRDVLDTAKVRSIRDGLMPWFETTPHGRGEFEGLATQRVYNLIAKLTVVHPLAIHPVVMELARAHLGPGFQLSIAQAVRILPGETEQTLHTDDLPFPMPKPHQPVVLNSMWAVTDFTKPNGATRLVPGSHGRAEFPSESECIHAEMKAGSVLVWDGSVFHGGGANTTTDQERIGLTINYNASWLRQQENQYLAVPREMVLQMPDELKRLIGYELFGVLGVVDGRHPLKSL